MTTKMKNSSKTEDLSKENDLEPSESRSTKKRSSDGIVLRKLNATGTGLLHQHTSQSSDNNSLDINSDSSIQIPHKESGYMEDDTGEIQTTDESSENEDLTARGTRRKIRKPRPRGSLGDENPKAEKHVYDVKLGARVERKLKEKFIACAEGQEKTQGDALTEAIEDFLDKYTPK